MRAATKKNRKKISILRIVRFTEARDTFVSTTQKKEKWKKWKKFKKVSKWQNGLEPRVVPQVPQNKWFGEGTKRAFPRWCQFMIKSWWKMTLSIFKFWCENRYEIMNSGFQQQWFFRPILTETYILLHDLHHFLKVCRSKSPLEEPLQCTKSTLT